MTSLKKYFKDDVFRNIPTAKPRISIFDNGLNSEKERDEILDIANSVTDKDHTLEKKSSSWYKYGEDEVMTYVFENLNIKLTRFSTGRPPIWYGSASITNCIEETAYHLERNVRHDLINLPKNLIGKIDYVENEKAILKAKIYCESINDCRSLKKAMGKTYSDSKSYGDCTTKANDSIAEGHDGLIYLSARSQNDVECFAIWNRKSIVNSYVVDFYSIIIYSDSKKDTLAIRIGEN